MKSVDDIGVDEALGLFVERVRVIEYVDEIRCVQVDSGHEVWTFISAPPFEAKLRFPIYDVEWEVTERISEPLLDFRVVNTRESDCNVEATIAPAGSLLLWKRADARYNISSFSVPFVQDIRVNYYNRLKAQFHSLLDL